MGDSLVRSLWGRGTRVTTAAEMLVHGCPPVDADPTRATKCDGCDECAWWWQWCV